MEDKKFRTFVRVILVCFIIGFNPLSIISIFPSSSFNNFCTYCRAVGEPGFIPFFRYIDNVQENYYDILIGAGHKTYSFLLDIKKYQKDNTKNIAILTPSFKKDKLIVSPVTSL